jgi:gluconate kinase
MKEITILFGEMGGGKNYWGEIIANTMNVPFFDGDDVVTPEMLERVKGFKSLTREMIIRYVNGLANVIADKAEQSNGLVVAQALYLDEDRLFLQKFLQCLGYRVRFIWIKTSFWRNLKQIYSRKSGLRWVFYWLMNKPFFQPPTHHYSVL